MARSVKNIQDAIERKKKEIADLEAAELVAAKADEDRTKVRTRDFQAKILGYALLDLAGNDASAIKTRIFDSLSVEDQMRFRAGPVDPGKATKSKTDGGEKSAAGEDAGSAKAA